MHGTPKADAYGVVMFNSGNKVLLRAPSGHFGGYVRTFATGRPDTGATPSETAIRDALAETGSRSNCWR